MIDPTTILFILIGLSIALIGALVLRPSITTTRAGKILAFVALFILPLLSAAMGGSEHMERSKQTQFCLSCHIMEPYGKSLLVDDPSHLATAHFQNNRVPASKPVTPVIRITCSMVRSAQRCAACGTCRCNTWAYPRSPSISTTATTIANAYIAMRVRALSRKAPCIMLTPRRLRR